MRTHVLVLCALASIAGCGARSALELAPDGAPTIDAGPSVDAAVDATLDARIGDASIDAPPPDAPDACRVVGPGTMPDWARPTTSVLVTAQLDWDAPEERLPSSLDFTLAMVARDDGTIVATAQSAADARRASASASEIELRLEGDSLTCASDPCELVIVHLDEETQCARALSVAFSQIELSSIDADCDGLGDRLEGASGLTAGGATAGGASRAAWTGRARWQVRRDDEPPRLALVFDEPFTEDWMTLGLVPSEPLALDTEVHVTASDGTRMVDVPATEGSFFVSRAITMPVRMLARGGSAGARAMIRDLAGNRGEGNASTRTGEAHAYPDDGFESGTGVDLGVGASLFDGDGIIPPIDGARSVMLGGPASGPRTRWVALSTRVAPGVSEVVLDVRILSASDVPFDLSTLRIIATADVGRSTSVLGGELAVRETGSTNWPHASDVTELRVDVPALVRPNERLEIAILYVPAECGALPRAHAAVLIDDLRVE